MIYFSRSVINTCAYLLLLSFVTQFIEGKPSLSLLSQPFLNSSPCSNSEFKCADGLCVDISKKCNRQNDCLDASDESDCESICLPSEFRCNDGHCIPLVRRCDKYPDCRDGSDEAHCQICGADEFQCRDGYCIPNARRCDGFPHCRDSSDESECSITTTTSPPSRCRWDEFQCVDRHCIPDYRRCDGVLDCKDGTDESGCSTGSGGFLNLRAYISNLIVKTNCVTGLTTSSNSTSSTTSSPSVGISSTTTNRTSPLSLSDEFVSTETEDKCGEDQFKCQESKKCIPLTKKCDGNYGDCYIDKPKTIFDKSDESHCRRPTCRPDQITCYDGVCIEGSQKCDGGQDCSRGEDEDGCETDESTSPPSPPPTPPPSPPPLQCSSYEFKCGDGSCIDISRKCNQQIDCSDASDEWNCQIVCLPSEFRCSDGHCIPFVRRCDRYPDCRDGSDETQCQICERDEFQCRDGHCIPNARRCDGVQDCRDYSDEFGCLSPTTPTTTTSTSPPTTSRCRFDEFTCQDRHCVPWYRRCDGSLDCRDGSDEFDCSTPPPPSDTLNLRAYPGEQNIKAKSCQADEFQCEDGHCIPNERRCDGLQDCRDYSDESDCPSMTTTTSTPST